MTNYTKWMLGLVALLLIVSFVVLSKIQDRFSEPEEHSIQDVAERLEALYSGKVDSFEQKNDIYHFTLNRHNTIYNIAFDSKTGNFIDFIKVDSSDSKYIMSKSEIRTLLNSKMKGTINTIKLQMNGTTPQYIVELIENEALKTVVVNAETGEIVSEKVKEQTPTEPTVTAISSDKAKQIALSQFKGSVQYIVFEPSSDGGFYLVEIENEQQKAKIEIHAISGKVLSVTRVQKDIDDDDDDIDEDDENDDDDLDEVENDDD
ncbi:PepSY domain-containing protein [Ureibacillus manganicus]|uniref:PepSY domain-containing protein n=1 Tax=Ureibacillus manganicus DSM 26584 TaxID=1384049 RepID=A0A0A3I6G0_9BACL|nr:PepSY domain-containing protein [Ureibacillus manganicus]KGR79120.1 hypothetical protein CD29_07125 [Ureibacillus manganicus DSM 26584]